MNRHVGVAGCGRMGLPMARSLRAAGFHVSGYDIRPPVEFGDFADSMVPDAQKLSELCDVVFTVVRDAAQTDSLLFGEKGLLVQQNSIKYLVVCSTLSPKYITELQRRINPHIILIDAPMSGAQIAASEARLSFMLGGLKADLDAIQPFLSAMGQTFHHMGGTGAGMTAKVLNNFVAASSVVAVRQALDWADELNVDEDKLLALMHDSSGQTWFGTGFNHIEFSRDGYAENNTIGILKKDVLCALDAVEHQPDQGLPAQLLSRLQNMKPR